MRFFNAEGKEEAQSTQSPFLCGTLRKTLRSLRFAFPLSHREFLRSEFSVFVGFNPLFTFLRISHVRFFNAAAEFLSFSLRISARNSAFSAVCIPHPILSATIFQKIMWVYIHFTRWKISSKKIFFLAYSKFSRGKQGIESHREFHFSQIAFTPWKWLVHSVFDCVSLQKLAYQK